MAKKKIISAGTPTPTAPARRRAPAGKKTEKTEAADNGRREPTHAQIAEAAYFRHLKRGGTHGDQFHDWIEAERELKSRH